MRYDISTDPTISLLDAAHDNQRLVSDACHSLEDVARALSRVGMRDLADEIGVWITPLMQSAKQVCASYSVDLSGQLSHGQAMIGGMLTLALNGNLKPSDKSANQQQSRTFGSQAEGGI